MDATKTLSTNLSKVVREITTVTAADDVAGATKGKYILCTNAAAKSVYFYYNIRGQADASPGKGISEVSNVTAGADTAGSLAGKYFTLGYGPSSPAKLMYAYYEISTFNTPSAYWKNFDPMYGASEVTDFTLPDDTAGNQAGKYFNLYGGANVKHYVWYDKGGSTDPAVADSIGIRVQYTTGMGKNDLAKATVKAIAAVDYFNAEMTATSGKFRVINKKGHSLTDATNGDLTALTVAVIQAGIDAVGGIATHKKVKISIASGALAATVATATRAALAGFIDGDNQFIMSGSSAAVIATGKYAGNCTNVGAGTTGWTVSTSTAGVNPNTTDIFIPIVIDSDAEAATIAAATRTQVNLTDNIRLTDITASGATTAIILTNRTGGVAGTASTTNTGWTIARTLTGTTSVTTNMDATASKYWYVPACTEKAYLRIFNFTANLVAAGVVDFTKFLGLTALTNGMSVQIINADGTVKKLIENFKCDQCLTRLFTHQLTESTSKGEIWKADLVGAFGEEIEVDGMAGEYLEVFVNDDISLITGPVYFGVNGKVKS